MPADPKRALWIDTDIAIGEGNADIGYADVDDAWALLHIHKSGKFNIMGISSVFGNTENERAFRIANDITQEFLAEDIAVVKGAEKALDLMEVKHTQASELLAKVLGKNSLTILAIGPATNLANVLLLHPELARNVDEVVMVAGRRSPHDHFKVGPLHHPPFPDLNFDLDPLAFSILLQSGIKITLMPYEISHKVWITRDDLEVLSGADEACKYLAENSHNWLNDWKKYGCDGFNPFDVLASACLVDTSSVKTISMPCELQWHPDDTISSGAENVYKPYLIVSKVADSKRNINYGYDVVPDFKSRMMETLTK